ncbi:MAG: M23 family metallopeptidase [Nocardioidaceae bacterium]
MKQMYRHILATAAALVWFGLGLTSPSALALSTPTHWVWPLDPPPQVVAGFEPPESGWGPGHRGVDLLGHPGQRVLAIGSGTVTFATTVARRGVVVVDHGRLRSTYEPVDALVRVGDRITAGSEIGRLVATGSHCAPAACLHVGVLRGQTYVDPLSLLDRPVRVRLKPLSTGWLSGQQAAGGSSGVRPTQRRPGPPGATHGGPDGLVPGLLVLGGGVMSGALLTGVLCRRQARG